MGKAESQEPICVGCLVSVTSDQIKRISNAKAAALIVEHARKKGNDTTEIRDASHEICHVFQIANFKGRWERENTHKQLEARAKREAKVLRTRYEAVMMTYEFQARAVEWIVCERLDFEYDVDHWITMMIMESVRTIGAAAPGGFEGNLDFVEKYKKRSTTMNIVERVLKLGGIS